MDVFSIIAAIVASVLFLVVDLYLLAFYSHRGEPNRSCVNLLCKLLILVTMLQTQAQPLFLVLDSTNSRHGEDDLSPFWFVLYLSILANLAVLKPIATSLYERDHDETCCCSAFWIVFEVVVSTAVFGAFVGVNYALWEEYAQSEDSGTGGETSSTSFTQQGSDYYNFMGFIVAFFCVVGYPILVCCGGCGMTVLPLSWFIEFANRPQYRRTSDAKKVSEYLKVQTVRLLKENERLQRQAVRVDDAEGFFERRRVGKEFKGKLAQAEGEVELQCDFYELFKMELQMEEVNPMVWCGKVTLGVLAVVGGLLLWVQILLAQLVYPPSEEDPSVFLDSMFGYFERENATFVSVGLLMLVAFYFSLCIMRGSIFLSTATPFVRLHPIAQDKTWLNSFLFHLSLCVLAATALLHLLVSSFPHFLRSGSIVRLLEQLDNLTIMRFILSNHIFTYAFLVVAFLGAPFVCCKMLGGSKGELVERIEEKRMKLFGKQARNDTTMVEMVELNQKKHRSGRKNKKH